MSLLNLEDRNGHIWYDGAMRDWRDSKIHVLAHSLQYGSAVFEGERVYGGKVFKLTRHSERLHKSAQMIGMELPYSVSEIDAATIAVVRANNLEDAYVRPVAWRGAEVIGVGSKGTKVHLAIAAFPWPSYYGAKAISLKTSRWKRPSPESAPTGAKCAGLYVICTMARDEALAAGYDDAFMLDYRGRIAEATGANLFFLIDGELHTPEPDCFLNGITRLTVMDLARQHGFKVIERAMQPDEISQATEVFITGTAVEVTAVNKIDDQEFEVGPVTRQLAEAYSQLVRQ